eukprot:2293504-Pyramimonas_sp.AAC.1
MSTLTTKDGMSNAFGSSSRAALRQTVEVVVRTDEQVYFHQRHELSTSRVLGADGDQDLHNRCGAFVGGTPAALFFTRTFRESIAEWLRRLRAASWATYEMPAHPTTYEEWKRHPLLPPAPRADVDTTIWP